MELYQAVNEASEGPQTWSAIDLAVSRAVTNHVDQIGSLAHVCAPDGTLDDLPLRVRWDVSTRGSTVMVDGGHVNVEDVPAGALPCIERYLAAVTGEFPGQLPLVELDILFEMPIPAGGR